MNIAVPIDRALSAVGELLAAATAEAHGSEPRIPRWASSARR